MGSRGLLGREYEDNTSLEDVLRSNGEDSIRDIDVPPLPEDWSGEDFKGRTA